MGIAASSCRFAHQNGREWKNVAATILAQVNANRFFLVEMRDSHRCEAASQDRDPIQIGPAQASSPNDSSVVSPPH